MLNKVMVIGRLGQDPEMRYMPSGDPVANFSVATSEYFRNKEGQRQEKTEWFRVVVYGKQAENVNTYLKKGSQVYVEGSLRTQKWQDKQGIDRTTVEINARTIQFLDRRGDGPASNDGYSQPYNNQNQNSVQSSEDYGSPFPSEASSLDDMPF